MDLFVPERRRQRVLLQLGLIRLTVNLLLARMRTVAAPRPLPQPKPAAAQARRRVRRANIQRQRMSPLSMTSEEILTTYHFDMDTIKIILADILEDLSPEINIRTSIPPLLKLMSVLHFCATGTFQNTTALLHGLSQPTFSAILKQVMAALIKRVDSHIYMPRTEEEMTAAKVAFYAIAKFPHVIGCIDCTHVGLIPPNEHEQSFGNQKMCHSLNIQMVCDAHLCIMEICARFSGSVPDAQILRATQLFDFMEQEAPPRTLLLGDSAYPLLPWLMTPLSNPVTAAEQRYNAAHVKTHNCIERAFGLLKSRFRCLGRSGGALLYKPEKVGDIIVLCTILHNIAIRHKVPIVEAPAPEDEGGNDELGLIAQHEDVQEGREVQNGLIRNFFTQ